MEARTRSRLEKWIGAVLASVLLTGFVAPFAAALLLRAVAREKVIELLEKRFDRVGVEKLDVRLFAGWNLLPRISAKGTGLSVSLPHRAEAPPFITMGEFTVDVGLLDLASDPIRVRSLRLDELEIQIPPKRGAGEKGSSTEKEPPPPFVIEELVADGAVLRILRRNPEDPPLEFDLHELRVLSAGVNQPMRFESLLDNPKPPGRIKTKGSFGPLVLREPGESPVSGDYVFADADLSVFGGIEGTLYAEGRFDGLLERIEVNGFTETPDFQLTSVGNPVHLKTQFHAVVDGTNGNTLLTPVNAVLESSRFETVGGVSRLPKDKKGKTVCVDAQGDRGQIQDFLRLVMKSERPFMTGEVRFQSMVLIPPGDVDVVERLFLDGEFAIESAHFPEPAVQKRVDDLSHAGSGARDAEEAAASLRAERVLSDIRGVFQLSRGVLKLSSLGFTVPGASVTLRGTYELKTARIDLQGELRMDAELSEATTGLKSFLLKLVDPLFKKKGTGAVVPIKIAGTADKPSFGVDLGRVLTRREVASPVPATDGFRRSIPSCSAVFRQRPDDPGRVTRSSRDALRPPYSQLAPISSTLRAPL